jgi:hypothetical protein
VLCRFYGRLPLNRKAAAEAETSSSLKTLWILLFLLDRVEKTMMNGWIY